RETFKQVLAQTSDRKLAKEASGKMKKFLPAVLWSGHFLERSDKGLQQHSGLLCADLDDLGDQLSEVRAKLRASPYLWAMFTSPTGEGLKCVFRISPSVEQHLASF